MKPTLTVLALVLLAPVAAIAQDVRPLVVDVAIGSLTFPDDGAVHDAMVGTAARLYLSPRVSIGPELTFIHGQDHHYLMFTGNAIWDLRRAPSRVGTVCRARRRRVPDAPAISARPVHVVRPGFHRRRRREGRGRAACFGRGGDADWLGTAPAHERLRRHPAVTPQGGMSE